MRNDPITSDEALYEAWRAGDRQAGHTLFDRHFDSIYRFFESKAHGDVSDLVQRTFLGCVEARDRFRGASSFRTFLFAVARHELSAHFRSRRRGAVVDFGVSSVADLAPGPSSFARQRSERAALGDALRSLPVDLQIAIELRFWESLSGPDLAVVLEVPEGTVRSRLRRALEALRAALGATTAGQKLCGGPAEDLEEWATRLHDETMGGLDDA